MRADAQPYRANSLSLDSRTLSAALELEDGVKQVVPRRGAVVKAVFKARSGRRVQFSLRRRDGAAPFGASVEDGAGRPGHRGPARPDTALAHAAARPADREMERRRLQRPLSAPPAKPGRHYQRLELPCH